MHDHPERYAPSIKNYIYKESVMSHEKKENKSHTEMGNPLYNVDEEIDDEIPF